MDGAPRAAMPAAPQKQYSFTDFQVNHPTAPPPGDRLDAELARITKAIAAIIAWVGTSLNTDGTLRHGAIGKNELKTGLFDDLAAAIAAEAQRVIAEGLAAARAAMVAAGSAQSAAAEASRQGAVAMAAAQANDATVKDAAADATDAAQSAAEAAASAEDAANSAGNADGSEAVCTDYGVLTQAWAEHMPDTIPPNILAVMDVTGDHWSSRWWANHAAQIVTDASGEAVCDIQQYWLGAFPVPPTQTSCGEPISPGAMYWNTTSQVTQVYDGSQWHDVVQLAPANVVEYLYLPATPTTVFSGADYHGNTLALDTVNAEIGVYLNGVKLLLTLDYTFTATSLTLATPVTTPNTVEIVSLKKVSPATAPPSGVKVNTGAWVFDGVAKTFPLKDAGNVTINPAGSVDCIVSLNGVIQEAGGDFTTAPGSITFMTAPEADADKWMVVGIPVGS